MAGPGTLRGKALIRVALILVGGAIALWIATAVTINFTMGRAAPALARAWWPVGVQPQVAEGQKALLDVGRSPPAVIDEARAMLRGAILREPVNYTALGTLAALDEFRGDGARARTLFHLSEAMSRRGTLVQLWLIEDAVARGDVAAAITHYDRAMRVSYDVRPTLLPVLIGASSDPNVRRALAPVLAQRPRWWMDYVQRLGAGGTDADVMVMALRAPRIDISKPDERLLAEGVLRRMVAIGADRAAVQMANRLDGPAGPTRSLREGSFDGPPALLPFAWQLRDETSIRAYRDAVPDGTMGLRVLTSVGASGNVAQQLMGLAPGSYVLQGTVGGVAADPLTRATIDLRCSNDRQFARFVMPQAGEQGRRFRYAFTVPASNCGAQWIGITTAPAADTDMWMDNLAITR